MLRHLVFIIQIAVLLSLVGCVTVNLPKTTKGKAEGIQFESPKKEFQDSPTDRADRLWKHKNSGATLSYLSDCNDEPANLSQLESETLSALVNGKVLSQSNSQFNSREARQSEFEGTVEGIPVRVSQVSFRKNGCDYIIALVSRRDRHESHRGDFENFLKGFQAP